MSRRRAIWATLLSIAALAAAVVLYVNTPDPDERIRAGMTIDEIEAILGKPIPFKGPGLGLEWKSLTWDLGDRKVTIEFDMHFPAGPSDARQLTADRLSLRQKMRNWFRTIVSPYYDAGPRERPRGHGEWPPEEAE